MPNKHTFLIGPIADLVRRYCGRGIGWADPFSGENSPAEFTNDIDPLKPTTAHLEAHDFALTLPVTLKGVLFDPPYSLEQMKRAYENVHRTFTQRDGQIAGKWVELKDILAPKVELGGIAISFGWHSNGFGFKRNFEIIEILLVAHGGGHNDTIVTVERKAGHQERLTL